MGLGNIGWELLGEIVVEQNADLRVTLTGGSDGNLAADAIRLERAVLPYLTTLDIRDNCLDEDAHQFVLPALVNGLGGLTGRPGHDDPATAFVEYAALDDLADTPVREGALLDSAPSPRIGFISPEGTLPFDVSFVDVTFLDPIAPDSFTPDDVVLVNESLQLVLDDRFDDGLNWSTTDSSVAVTDDDLLFIAADGQAGDWAEKTLHVDLASHGPVVIEQRLKLHSNGLGFRLPWETVFFEDSSELAVTYRPSDESTSYGWYFGNWTGNNTAAVPREDCWVVTRILLTATSGELYVRLDDDAQGDVSNSFTRVAWATWSHSSIEKIKFAQPGDSANYIDYVRVYQPLHPASLAIQSVEHLAGTTYRVTFDTPCDLGSYRLRIGPDIRDADGTLMDQDRDGIAGELPDDVFVSLFTVSRAEPAIQGTFYHDLNGNGLCDADEPGIEGWTIFLDDNGNQVHDPGESVAVTDANGHYAFPGLLLDTPYYVVQALDTAWMQTHSPATPIVLTSAAAPRLRPTSVVIG